MRLTQPKRSYRLTDASVKRLPVPATGNKAYFDDRLAGFGCTVTKAGHRSFFLNYVSRAKERRFTIGSTVEWKAAARGEAARLKDQLRVNGTDPLAELAPSALTLWSVTFAPGTSSSTCPRSGRGLRPMT